MSPVGLFRGPLVYPLARSPAEGGVLGNALLHQDSGLGGCRAVMRVAVLWLRWRRILKPANALADMPAREEVA